MGDSALTLQKEIMKKIDCNKIGYYGKPIVELSREELLEAFAELASIVVECASDKKGIDELVFIDEKTLKEKKTSHSKQNKRRR